MNTVIDNFRGRSYTFRGFVVKGFVVKGREGQLHLLKPIQTFGKLVKFEHTIFALPYAYLGMILAAYTLDGRLPGWGVVFWVTLAMVGARSAAMALNRLIDSRIDAINPRTASREIPRGIVSKGQAFLFIVLSLLVMAVSAWMLNPLCFALFPVALVCLVGYSYTKRYTWLCHFALGVTDALAPLGGWLAVKGEFHPGAFILAAAVAVWIAGFDIIYACQDVDFDRKNRVYSVPSVFGVHKGLNMARSMHVLTVLLFLALPQFIPLGGFYYIGVLAVAVLLLLEHRLVSPNDMTRIHTAFFTINSYIALAAFVFTFIDVLVRLH
jgi:4-hydroxybenzoate polyprenyltransferase